MSSSLICDLKSSDDGIMVNNERQHVSYILKNAQKLSLTMHEEKSENIVPVNIPIDIVYEDEDIIIVNKPAAMPTHISAGNFYNTLSNAIMYHYGEDGGKFHAVNRLDKDTSGLMCVAKNKYSHSLLCEQIKNGVLKRKYTAIVCGDIKENGTVNAPISRESVIKRRVDSDGQNAVTHYSVKERFVAYTLIELELETGRTHQIRVHMAYIGNPLLGDWLYGTENKKLFKRQALHSSYISLEHPITKKRLEFQIGMPEDMKNFINGL